MNLLLKSLGNVKDSDEELKKNFTFVNIYLYTAQSINDGERTYYFQAACEQERNEWFRAIQLEISCPTNI